MQTIINHGRLTDDIVTSGQPTEEQCRTAAGAGCGAVTQRVWRIPPPALRHGTRGSRRWMGPGANAPRFPRLISSPGG
jgi:hypothetical protein